MQKVSSSIQIGLNMLLAFIIPLGLMAMVSGLAKESDTHRGKLESFECGFETFSCSRVSFSLKFYMVVIIFLVFDVEIALILPIPMSKLFVEYTNWIFISSGLIFILIYGLVLEWFQGVFEWVE